MKIEVCKICDHDHAHCKYGNNCREMIEVGVTEPEQKISDQLKSLEGYINDIPLVIDPCKICKHHDSEKGHEEKCAQCSWYYPSYFEAGGTK